MEKQTLSTQIY